MKKPVVECDVTKTDSGGAGASGRGPEAPGAEVHNALIWKY